uniref:Protein kinase domain-containing protein n=1 Tax=Amphiprion percula TaxID=161767 RepID=A0A3P8U1U0_AMPPE
SVCEVRTIAFHNNRKDQKILRTSQVKKMENSDGKHATTLNAKITVCSVQLLLQIKGSTLGSCHIVEEILGEGNFGVVAKCRNTLTNKTAAVKVHKKKLKNAIEEIFILKWLHRHGSDACNIVRWDGYFFDKEKLCISFEHLDQSLHHYQMAQNAKRLSMVELKSVLHQLATALSHLHSIDIIHADLKPVNIMVVDRHQHPIKVKIIDFGLACFASQVQQGECRGTMSYNAPEMSLGVPFNEAIDMWALGVTMAELAMGCALYPGMTEYDVLRAIIETQGQPPDDMLDCGMYTEDFFYIDDYDARSIELRLPQSLSRHTELDVVHLPAASCEEDKDSNVQLPNRCVAAPSREEDVDFNVQTSNPHSAAPLWHEGVDFMMRLPIPNSAASWDEEENKRAITKKF